MANGNSELHFNGIQTYIEIPSHPDFSVPTTGTLSVSAWIKPETLMFLNTEVSGYVYWLGKGEAKQHEWVMRMYSQGNTENRANRISFYVFNSEGGLGVGSHFQDPLQVGVLYASDLIPPDGLVAEYLLTQDIAPETAGGHSGTIFSGSWTTT